MRTSLILLLLSLAASPAVAQTLGSVRVTVLFEGDNEPLPDVQVTLSGGALVQPRILTTDVRGDVCFIGVPSGDGYSVSISAPGFERKQGSIGHLYGGLTRHFVGRTRVITVYGCPAIEWHDVSFPEPGMFMMPPLQQPAAGFCL